MAIFEQANPFSQCETVLARDFGKKRQWENWTRGCSDVECVAIAEVEMEIGKDYSDRYSQGAL
jgi:hypothetical protein